MKASIDIHVGDVAQAVHDALVLECQDGPPGSVTTMRLDGETIHLDIEAKDLSTLRAAINVVRLLDTAQRACTVGARQGL